MESVINPRIYIRLIDLIIGFQRRLGELWRAITGPWAGRIALAALMISANWGVFIWAVQAGHVVQSSLGYYIYPLIAVLLGVVIFRERLGGVQALAVLMALTAVVTLTWGLGVAPWISLSLATTMGLYGVVKKSLPLGPVMLTAGAKLSYLDVDGRNEWAVPVGGRIGMSLGQSFGVYAQGYAASNGMASGNIHQYQDGEIGASFTPFKPLTVSAGYRYSDVELAGGSWKRKLADGPFVGAALSF